MQNKTGGLEMKIVILDGYTENPGDFLSWKDLRIGVNFEVYDRTPVEKP